MKSMGRHRDEEVSGRDTETSERLRAQPAILHYKCEDNPALPRKARPRNKCLRCPGENCLKRRKSRALFEIPEAPTCNQSETGRASTRETPRIRAARCPRQPKPTLGGLRPQQVPVKRSTALQSRCHLGSALQKGSLEPPKHTPDIDLHYCQSSCNPGKGTRYSTESVGASGTMPHR